MGSPNTYARGQTAASPDPVAPPRSFAPKVLECIPGLSALSGVSTIPLTPFLVRKGEKKKKTGDTPVPPRQRGKAPLHSLKPKFARTKDFWRNPP